MAVATWLLMNRAAFLELIGHIQVHKMYYLFFAICLFMVVHFLKAFRIYLILLESNIPIMKIFQQYFKTTFATILIPYKLGDFYKIICFSKESKSFKTGLLAVLIDRFFDTIVLLLFLVIYQTMGNSNRLSITIIIIAFLLIMVLANIVLYITYPYSNHFLVSHGTSKKSLRALGGLEDVKNLQRSIISMIKGRTGVIMLISMIGWGLEFVVLMLINMLFDKSFDFLELGKYVEHSFFGSYSTITVFYFYLSSILLISVASYMYLKSFFKGRIVNE
jgi:uncharacterized protein (TIRG00374 family)